MISDSPFKWRHIEGQIILLCVRWYLRYCLSCRDLEELMAERGLNLDHTTIYRWVQKYAPELDISFAFWGLWVAKPMKVSTVTSTSVR